MLHNRKQRYKPYHSNKKYGSDTDAFSLSPGQFGDNFGLVLGW